MKTTTEKMIFDVNGKSTAITVTGTPEAIQHVKGALVMLADFESMAEERARKNLELANHFKKQFTKSNEVRAEDAAAANNDANDSNS